MGKMKELYFETQLEEIERKLEERIESQEIQIIALNTAFHDLLQYIISRGEINSLITHPNSTIRLTASSYYKKDMAEKVIRTIFEDKKDE